MSEHGVVEPLVWEVSTALNSPEEMVCFEELACGEGRT